MTIHEPRRGSSAVGVIFAVILVTLLCLYLLISVPRGREAARRASCQRNLMQIGTGLGLYHQSGGQLPSVRIDAPSPFAQMLNELGQPDFMGLGDRKVPPKRTAPPSGVRPVRGLACPSDPAASDGRHPAPTSYRWTTGDTTDGQHGPFAVDRAVAFSEVDAGKGSAYTAACSERLVGGGRIGDLATYALVDGPVSAGGCPAIDPARRLQDAGASWLSSSWAFTLYNHASLPNASPSCVAADGKSALMGTSSGHPEGVNVLLLDGSVKIYRPTVALPIWQTLATVGATPR